MWEKAMQDGVIQNEWLSQFQGAEGSDMPIIEKTDLTKGGGQTINFTVESELVGDGKKGAAVLIGNEEKLNRYTYSCVVDWQRHAVATDSRTASFTAAKRKLGFNKLVSRWCARHKQWEALLSYIKKGAFSTSGIANNLFYSGGGAADADLTTSNGLDTGVFDLARYKLISLGAKAAQTSKDDSYDAPFFHMWATSRALRNLNNDSAWNNANLMARPREGSANEKNPLWTGCFSGKTYNGIIPYEYMLPDHDNAANGAIGCPLEPRALLRAALTDDSVTALTVGGSSGSSTPLYLRDFPGYDYLFTADQTAAADSGTYYFKIINLPGSTQAGKYEVCSYTGSANNGKTISTIVRNVLSNSQTTVVHDANSLVVPCTATGVEYGHVIITGAMSLLRAYGEFRERLTSDKQDYGFVNGVGVESIFGQTPAQRTDGRYPGYVVARVALN